MNKFNRRIFYETGFPLTHSDVRAEWPVSLECPAVFAIRTSRSCDCEIRSYGLAVVSAHEYMCCSRALAHHSHTLTPSVIPVSLHCGCAGEACPHQDGNVRASVAFVVRFQHIMAPPVTAFRVRPVSIDIFILGCFRVPNCRGWSRYGLR